MGDVWWRRYLGWVIVAAVVAFVGIAQLVNAITGNDRTTGGSSPSPSAASQEPAATYATSWPTRPPAASPPAVTSSSYDEMPGDGTYQMGGMDGKNWGVWTAVAVEECTWSVRAVTPGAPGQVLNEGTAQRGERVRVAINPSGDVSLGGMVDDSYRVVFMTNGCGAWSSD
jgi:hypothetical protein